MIDPRTFIVYRKVALCESEIENVLEFCQLNPCTERNPIVYAALETEDGRQALLQAITHARDKGKSFI